MSKSRNLLTLISKAKTDAMEILEPEVIDKETKEITKPAVRGTKVRKNKLYFNLLELDLASIGIVEKKQKYNYVSWTYMEMALRFLDPEADVYVTESIYPNMISLEIFYFGKKYKQLFPILDMANQGAIIWTKNEVVNLNESELIVRKSEETEVGKDDGKILGKTQNVITKQEVVTSKELVFLQSENKNNKEGRKAAVTSMQLNNSIMRGMAKAVSRVTGLGIKVYSGEDLRQYEQGD